MVNRSIEQKKLKMKRRNRYAVFSGATARFATRVTEVLEHVGEDKTRVRRIEVLVGPVSFSNQVINTGRGPSSERMAEYYTRVTPGSFLKEVPPTIGYRPSDDFVGPVQKSSREDVYRSLLKQQSKDVRWISIVSDEHGTLDLLFSNREWFFVEINHRKKIIRRSRVYGSKAFALGRLQSKSVMWIETITMTG